MASQASRYSPGTSVAPGLNPGRAPLLRRTYPRAFDIGTGPGQSDWAFNQWDGALGSVITINENAFTAAIRDGYTTGSPWIALIPAIGIALIAALAIAGTRPRLAEYR